MPIKIFSSSTSLIYSLIQLLKRAPLYQTPHPRDVASLFSLPQLFFLLLFFFRPFLIFCLSLYLGSGTRVVIVSMINSDLKYISWIFLIFTILLIPLKLQIRRHVIDFSLSYANAAGQQNLFPQFASRIISDLLSIFFRSLPYNNGIFSILVPFPVKSLLPLNCTSGYFFSPSCFTFLSQCQFRIFTSYFYKNQFINWMAEGQKSPIHGLCPFPFRITSVDHLYLSNYILFEAFHHFCHRYALPPSLAPENQIESKGRSAFLNFQRSVHRLSDQTNPCGRRLIVPNSQCFYTFVFPGSLSLGWRNANTML